MDAWTHGITVIQNMTETQLREEVNRLLDTIDAQNAILENVTTIETEILKMKAINQDKKQIFHNLNKEIEELKRINTELHERILVWKGYIVPPPEINSDAPAFVPPKPPKPKQMPPQIIKLPKDPKPEPKSNLRY